MNYYQPREKKDPATGAGTGLWHYTCMNDGRIWAVGYCRELNCHHGSEQEASACYRRYIKERCNNKLPGGFPLSPQAEADEVLQMVSSY